MSDSEAESSKEWLIHRFECPNCEAETRADRSVSCFRCGTEMERAEFRIGVVEA